MKILVNQASEMSFLFIIIIDVLLKFEPRFGIVAPSERAGQGLSRTVPFAISLLCADCECLLVTL